jgi:PAS domain-containing protein
MRLSGINQDVTTEELNRRLLRAGEAQLLALIENAPLGIVRAREKGGDGADIAPLVKAGVAAVDLNQSGTRYFDYHHTPEDTLERIDKEQLRQNVAAWTAMLAVVANAPEALVKPK